MFMLLSLSDNGLRSGDRDGNPCSLRHFNKERETMRSNFEHALEELLKHEGGYVFHKLDPGGMTNLGVTKRVWEEWVNRPVDEAEMRALTPDTVAPLYKAKYWDMVHGDQLPSGVDLCVFDCAVNSGVKRASKLLQRAVGVDDDGVIGRATLAAVEDISAEEVIDRFCAERLSFLEALPTFATFGKGWSRRVAGVKTESLNLA
jgi:lysozyme family protein